VTVYGYDPARIEVLRTRLLEAIGALDGLRSGDPAAADALRTVRLLRRNLSDTLLPVVDAIHTSTAMVSWRSIVMGRWPIDPGGWIATNGLDDVSDPTLIGRLSTALDHFGRAVDGNGGVPAAQSQLRTLLAECSRRATIDDGEFAAMMWQQLGTDGFERLLDRTASAVGLASAALIGDGSPAAVASVAGPAARLIAAVTSEEPEARDLLVGRVARTPHLLDAILHERGAFDPTVVRALAQEMLAYVGGLAHWAERPRVADAGEQTGRLLGALAAAPSAALVLLSEPAYLRIIVTDTSFADDDVEALVAAAIGHVDPSDRPAMAAGLRVVAELVRLTGDVELSDGARRGVAVGLGPHLPLLTPQLDRRLPVIVPIDADVSIGLGSYMEVARLVGQVLDDNQAQLALGAVVGSFRDAQYESVVTALRERGDIGPSDSALQLAAELADVTRFVRLVDDARAARDQLLAFRHGLAMSLALERLSTITTAATFVFPSSRLAVRLGSVLATTALDAVGSRSARTVPSTGIEADLAIHFTWALVALPLQHRDLRTQLGLGSVPAPTWRRLDQLSVALTETVDLDERVVLNSRMRDVIAADPDLDAYYEGAAALSGEARLS
jgi:hypothetical protein